MQRRGAEIIADARIDGFEQGVQHGLSVDHDRVLPGRDDVLDVAVLATDRVHRREQRPGAAVEPRGRAGIVDRLVRRVLDPAVLAAIQPGEDTQLRVHPEVVEPLDQEHEYAASAASGFGL